MKKTSTTNYDKMILICTAVALFVCLANTDAEEMGNVLNLTSTKLYDPVSWAKELHARLAEMGMVRRMRRSANGVTDQKTFPICPPLDAFEVINYENLNCPNLIDKQESKYTPTSIHRVLPISIVSKPRICACTQRKYTRWCFKKFFDSDQKEENVQLLEPPRSHCQALCDEMIEAGKLELIHGQVPKYSCWWMKGTTVEGVVTEIRAVNVVLNHVTKEVTNQFLTDGKCLWNSLTCRFQGGAYITYPRSVTIEKQLTSSDYSTETFSIRRITNSDMAVVRSSVGHVAYNVKLCCIRYGNYCLSPSIRGHLFDTTGQSLEDHGFKLCDSGSASITPPITASVVEDKSVDDLYREEHICHLTKQSILNSAKIGVPIAKRLLSVFNLASDGMQLVPRYFLSGKSLVHAQCMNVEYDSVEFHCPDIWVLKKLGSSLGCYDARANVAFAAKCRCYDNTTVSYIMNKYVVKKTGTKFSLDKYTYPESEVVEELTLLAQGYKDLLSYIQTPAGILIYEDPIIKGLKDSYLTNQTHAGVNLFGDFFGWFSRFRDLVYSVFGIAIAILGLYLVIKLTGNCRKGRKRVRADDHQDIVYERLESGAPAPKRRSISKFKN